MAAGKLASDTPKLYGSLQERRQQADYGVSITLDDDQARRIVANARRIVERMGALLAELGIWDPAAKP
ncbi:MAG: hypothetical protein ACYDCL_18305 [Myxococcales bacterium]